MINLDTDEAVQFWKNYILKNMRYDGAAPILDSEGIHQIAFLLWQKKVGRFDELMSSAELAKEMKTQSKLNDIVQLIVALMLRTDESKEFETPPDDEQILKTVYQTASQIFKVLHVELDPVVRTGKVTKDEHSVHE